MSRNTASATLCLDTASMHLTRARRLQLRLRAAMENRRWPEIDEVRSRLSAMLARASQGGHAVDVLFIGRVLEQEGQRLHLIRTLDLMGEPVARRSGTDTAV